MQQLKTGFKHTINRNKHHSKAEPLNTPNPYLDFLIDPSFQGLDRLFVLPFNVNDSKIGHSRYYLPTSKVEDYNVIIYGKNFFAQPIKNDIKTCENIRKITTGQGDDYTTGCLLDYNNFKKHKMIAIDLSEQQALNFTGNLSGNNNRLLFFIIEEVKETILDFSQGTVKVL